MRLASALLALAAGVTPAAQDPAPTPEPEQREEAKQGDETKQDEDANQGGDVEQGEGVEPVPADDSTPPPGETPAEQGEVAGSAPDPTGPASVDSPAEFDALAPLASFDAAGLAARFDAIAQAAPNLARAEVLTLEGIEVPLLTLGAADAPGPDARPALLFVGWGEPDEVETALAIAERAIEPAGALLLARATVYLMPMLAGRDGGAVAARNFPVGWRPETLVGGAGPYPLSEPASRVLAEQLQARANLVLMLSLRDGPCTGPELEGILAARCREQLRTLARAADNSGGPALAAASLCPATAASYAWAARGIFPARIDEPPVLDRIASHLARARAGAALEAARGLPGLVLGEPNLRVLKPGQVQLSLLVENSGLLPTRGAAASVFGHSSGVALEVAGAQVLACAAGPAPSGTSASSPSSNGGQAGDSVIRPRDGRFDLGDVSGGGALRVVLVLAGEPGAEVTLACRAPRAGSASLTVAIPE